MIKNGDLPAMPITEAPIVAECAAAWPDRAMVGLTKREQFASMALQGILSNAGANLTSEDLPSVAALLSIRVADLLLAELEISK